MKPRYTDAFWGEHPFDGHMILIKNKNKNMPLDVSLPLRLSWIWTFAMFWCLERYYMIITDILWYDLYLYTPVTDHMASIGLSNCVLPLPLLNMECAACMNFTTDTLLHHNSALTWTWTHDICTLSLYTWSMPCIVSPSQLSRDTGFERNKVRKNFS